MRPDQITRLRDLSESLAEVVIDEADPKTWPGAGKSLADLTKQERGDRLWSKKNAAASMMLLVKVMNIAGYAAGGQSPKEEAGEDLDGQVKQAEREAQALLERAKKGNHVH
jgi:hypothetical protein